MDAVCIKRHHKMTTIDQVLKANRLISFAKNTIRDLCGHRISAEYFIEQGKIQILVTQLGLKEDIGGMSFYDAFSEVRRHMPERSSIHML
jgi:hypothetical protein